MMSSLLSSGTFLMAMPCRLGLRTATFMVCSSSRLLPQAILKLLRFLIDIDAEEQPDQPHHQQNAADTEWVSHCIAHPHAVNQLRIGTQIGEYLLPGTKRRGVGHRRRRTRRE
ncbi:Uncharacterised protein [Serratia fonticola]|uniref:Uncharacterized protein n=1 Tax=Serratia fonticola TaxID=47917 RepID=A0A4U9WFY9_SERFO|nr:Uncharacterised protein [Serratia fonticola]